MPPFWLKLTTCNMPAESLRVNGSLDIHTGPQAAAVPTLNRICWLGCNQTAGSWADELPTPPRDKSKSLKYCSQKLESCKLLLVALRNTKNSSPVILIWLRDNSRASGVSARVSNFTPQTDTTSISTRNIRKY